MKLLVVFGLLTASINPALADQVVMKNGDRVTGTIVKKDGDALTIKTEQFGVVTASWAKVESVKVDAPVTVELQGKPVQGTLATTDGKIEIATQGTKLIAAPADVGAIRDADEQRAFERLEHPGWGQLWSGNATLGFAGSAGNAVTSTFTTGVTAARTTSTDKTSIYFNDIKASATANRISSETAQAVRGGISYDHNLNPRIFVSVSNDWENDKFQNLDLRYVIGGGFGYHFLKAGRSALDLVGGGDFNHSSYSTPLVQKTGEGYFGDTYSFKLNAVTSATQAFRIFDDLGHTGNFRANFDVGASTRLTKWLNWNLSFSDRYLNDPAPGRKTNDILYTTGVGVSFAR
jgi:putative salt-induced outer membrane protein YdiY